MIFSVMFDALEIRRENRVHAIANARQAAILLENDRQATLREDLMRRRSALKADLERVESMLDELDALRVLETAT